MSIQFANQSVNTLVFQALRTLNIVGRGQSATGQQLNDGVYCLNEILDSWNAKGILCYSLNIEGYTVNTPPPNNDASGQYYTYGPGGNFDTGSNPRPVNITKGTWSIPGVSVPNDLPMVPLTIEEYASVRSKTTTSSVATYFAYAPLYPLGKIYFWPIPTVQTTVKFTTQSTFPTALTASSTVQFPAGYAKAIRYELIISLAPMYGKAIPTDIASVYGDIKNDLTVNNVAQRIGKFKYPSSMPGTQGAYNIYTDSSQNP